MKIEKFTEKLSEKNKKIENIVYNLDRKYFYLVLLIKNIT
jgi:hypothetical protein